MRTSLLLLTLVLLTTCLPAVLGGILSPDFNEDGICNSAVGRCRSVPECNTAMQRMTNMCRGDDLNCRRCGLEMARMAGNRDGLSVLLCTKHFGRERRSIENFLQQCTNTDRTPPPGQSNS